MEILSVTLKNFKSHSDRHFVFQRGTNAICGENGAGKTSILEAIAWTLFNYRGAYKNEDLIRNGMSSAQAIVEFVSKRDGRTYAVKRCTTAGYAIYDPQLGQALEYKRIEDEIMPWLRQHLGVAPGTDLGRLFANTIGVPQGTFTADFLQAPENRKKTFDAILKVEEYRQTNQQMLSLEKYGKAEVDTLERSIAHYEDALQEWQPTQQRRQELSQDIVHAEAQLQQLQSQLQQLQTEKDQLAAKAQQVQQLEVKLQQVTIQIEGKQQAIDWVQQSVQQSKQAVEICTSHRPSYQAYLQAEEQLKQLNQQFKQRQIWLKQREQQQQRLAEHQTELTRLKLQLDRLTTATAELEQLHPLLQQQETLEQQQSEAIEQLQTIQAAKLEQQNLQRQQTQLLAEQTQWTEAVERLQALQSAPDPVADLEQKRDRLQQQLSRVEAAKQFEAELRQLVTTGEAKRDHHQLQAEQALATLREMQQTVPLLATAAVDSALGAIEAGVALNTDLINSLWRILSDLTEQVSVPKLQQQFHQLKLQLDAAYQQRAELATLEAKQTQLIQVQQNLKQVETQIKQRQAQLATQPQWQQRRQEIVEAIQQLGDPRSQMQLLQREIQQQATIQRQYEQILQQQSPIQTTLLQLEAQLAELSDLDEQIEQQKQVQQAQQPNYLLYLQHRDAANQLAKLEAEWQAAVTQLQTLETDRQQQQSHYEQLRQTYDPQQWQQVETQYNETRSQADQISGGLPQQRKLLAELDHQLVTLQTFATKRDRAEIDLAQKKKILKFVTFARKAYKEAGPRITERYVQTISHEADRLFRELLNRPNVALQWTRDYEILVQEGAHSRRFINLSGGEQMCAALAVRLALLRVLADIDVAFFDEPTTNMDKPRRESLAEAIANIKSFHQLFVISHDDTFEKVTENVILVEREA